MSARDGQTDVLDNDVGLEWLWKADLLEEIWDIQLALTRNVDVQVV